MAEDEEAGTATGEKTIEKDGGAGKAMITILKCPTTNAECCECIPGAPCAIRIKPSTYGQVSKALCGKENATPGELLQAVEQLKRRAETRNRMLTLEELKEHCKGGVEADPLWIEFREGQEFSRWVLANAPAAVFDFPLVTEWLKSKRSVSDYLKRWRCWLRRPSAEEMEREKWEE